jgi:Spy/CpxP family protein refolding chaperone
MNLDRQYKPMSLASPATMRCRVAAIALGAVLSSPLFVNSALAASPSLRIAMMDDKEMGSMGGQSNSSMSGMGGMSGSPSGGMGGMSGTSSGGMGGGCCMGSMGQTPGGSAPAGAGMSMQTNLPGFPGASHIYHVGATGFYLEYADKLGLSTQQRTSLNDVKQRTLVDQSNRQRKIDEAEQALWLLTAAEQPDAASVEAKIREIEKLKADQRLEFIRSVGEAAKILTDDQRRMVLGMVPMPGSTVPSASAPKPMNMGK